jgi:hypothetical protein
LIRRFIKVTDGLYRGSAPTPEDVINLQKHFGIKKIVSLDAISGAKIDKITKALGIQHIVIPINGKDYNPIIVLVSQNLKSLLLDDGPTFVHCFAGKDRTGMVIAMFQCKYMGMSYKDAIDEAHKIGFGLGLDPKVAKFYLQVIKKYCDNQIDNNDADIVDNSRPGDDWRGSVLDTADISSFAPYLDPTSQFPQYNVYNDKNDQYPTRNNKDLEKVTDEEGRGSDVPLVGTFDGDAAMLGGAGPVEPGGGFSGS